MSKPLTDAAIERLTKKISAALEEAGGNGHFVMTFPVDNPDKDIWDSRVLSTVPPEMATEVLESTYKEMREKVGGLRNVLQDKLN